MVIKKQKTTSGATRSGGNDGSGGTKGSGSSRGLDKVSNMIGTSTRSTGRADVVIHLPLINKIISLCGIPEDSTMVMFMFKRKWKELSDVLSADFDDINAFHMVKKDFKTVYIRMFKSFLLYCKRKCRENGGSLSEGDFLNTTSAPFKSYAGSDAYVIELNTDLKAWLEAYAAKHVVVTVNADGVGHINAQEPVKTTDVHGNRLQYESNLTENDSAHGFDVETRCKDVINDDMFVAKCIDTDVSNIMVNTTNASLFGHTSFNSISKSIYLPRDEWNKLNYEQKDRLIDKRRQERITGDDVSMKKSASKYVMEHDLEELTPGDDDESLRIRPPHGEYDAYQIYIDYSNVLFKDIDMIGHLDDNNGVRKPPDKIHERTKSKQERNERLIAGNHGDHDGLSIGNNSDPQGDIAFMTFDMHSFVVDTYDDDKVDDDDDDDNRIDGNDIDDDVDTLDDE
jgi:hypothetical protein